MLIPVVLLAAQVMVGKAGDPLMRPAIPDYFLIRQQWAQQELHLSVAEVKRLGDEIGRGMPTPQNPRIDPSKITYNDTMALSKKYEKRVRELSLWQADVLAFSNEWVQAQTGLSGDQRSRMDGLCRAFYTWYEAETKRLNAITPRTGEISKSMMWPHHSPDEAVTLKKLVILRKELRRQIPPSAMAKLIAMRGPAPHTAQPFGFPRATPYVYVPYTQNVLMNPRVHEELGFTMRQSRVLLENIRNSGNNPDLLAKVYSGLTQGQRARLRQLELQTSGVRAILNHDVLDRLGVDANQVDDTYVRLAQLQKQSQQVQNEEQQAYSGLYVMSGLDNNARIARQDKIRDTYRAKRQAVEDAIDASVLGLLDRGQRARWNAMLGTKVDGLVPRYN